MKPMKYFLRQWRGTGGGVEAAVPAACRMGQPPVAFGKAAGTAAPTTAQEVVLAFAKTEGGVALIRAKKAAGPRAGKPRSRVKGHSFPLFPRIGQGVACW